MGETTNTIPPKGIGNLQLSDFWKGLIKSTAGLFVGVLIKMIQNKFQLPPYHEIAPILEAAVYFLVGYLGINLGTNNEGKLFKKDAPTTTVPTAALKEVVEQAKDANAK